MAKSQSITELQLGKPYYIYIVEDLERTGFKVGVTASPEHRFRQLQIATSSKLKMLGWWRGTREDEDAIKAALHSFRGPSEWFNVSLDVMIETVARYCRVSIDAVTRDIESGVRAIQPRTAPLKKSGTGRKKRIKENPIIDSLPVIQKVLRAFGLPVETWVRLRIIALDLDKYDPDSLYIEWLKMEK